MCDAEDMRPLKSDDVQRLHRIMVETGVFTEDEVQCALDLMNIYLSQPEQQDYYFYVHEESGDVVGYACFGPVPLSEGSYNLYWIAIDPNVHGKGIGKKLMRAVEDEIRRRGGRRIYVETSGTLRYEKTRSFYLSLRYRVAAILEDFYRLGDDKVIFEKAL